MNKASKVVIFRVALDGSDYIPPEWDELNPDITSNQNCTGAVYDSLGNRHEIELFFRPTDLDGFMRLIMSVCGNALFSDDDGELVIHTGLESTISGELREMPEKASRRLCNGQ